MNKQEQYDYFCKSFTNIKSENEQINRIEVIRNEYKLLLKKILDNCIQSRELSIALSNLENSLMYAVKSKFINKLQKLRGNVGKFVFHFENKDSYEYETNRLYDLIHTLFSCTLWQHIDQFEPDFQELYKRKKGGFLKLWN